MEQEPILPVIAPDRRLAGELATLNARYDEALLLVKELVATRSDIAVSLVRDYRWSITNAAAAAAMTRQQLHWSLKVADALANVKAPLRDH